MAEKKKPSGAQFRKRKAEKEKEQAKQEHSLRKFLQVVPPKYDGGTSKEMEVEKTDLPTTSQGQLQAETAEVALSILEEQTEMVLVEADVSPVFKDQPEMGGEVSNVPAVSQGQPQLELTEVALSPLEELTEMVVGEADVLTVLNDHPAIEAEEVHLPVVSDDLPNHDIKNHDVSFEMQVEVQSQEHESVIQNLNFADPSTWAQFLSKNTDRIRKMLVEHGPEQVKMYNFPRNSFNRRFSKGHYTRTLANGEHVQRQWLQYSISQNSVFCFCCKLFTVRHSNTVFCNTGFNNWKNISTALATHERSSEHLQNFQKWKELEIRLKRKNTIDEHLGALEQEEKYWQQILERLISLVRVLGMQNLTFTGTHEKLHTYGNGHFLKFVEFLSAFDPLMDEHLRRIKDDETHVHYLGKETQNELISLLSNDIRDQILASVRSAKYFSIILDCTPDVAHVEQMTMILRFVDVASHSDAADGECVFIREHFVGFIPLQETTGAAMTETILHQLKEMSLPIENMRGQSYDNGSNMKAKEKGVQQSILNINPRALFVPCSAHSLNLVVNDAAKCCLEAMTFFDLVQQIYVYFSFSTHRWDVLKRHVHDLTMTPLSATRWESRIDALKHLRYQLANIYDAITEMACDTTLKGAHGNISRAEAKGLAKAIHNFNFVVSLVVWHSILFEINLTSKLLQVKGADICDALKQLKATKRFLVDFRSDKGFETALVEACEIAKHFEVQPDFESEVIHVRRKKQFSYKADDEPIQSPKDKFKVNFFFAVLDTAIQSVDERFTQLDHISSVFGFLYNIHSLHNKQSSEIMEHCLKLQQALQHKDSKDIDAYGLYSELKTIALRVKINASPEDVLAYVCKCKLMDSVPNVVIALRILLTLPVSVATGEGSFSKLKLIKTYVRSSMVQEKLSGLANLSIENEIAQKLDLKELVSKFALLKSCKSMEVDYNPIDLPINCGFEEDSEFKDFDGVDVKDMRLEAEAVVNDVLFAVGNMFVSKNLPSAVDVAYINVEIREGTRYCLELTEAGLRVVGHAFDQVNDDSQTLYHETIYSLLDSLSPAYREAFGNALLQRLEALKRDGQS